MAANPYDVRPDESFSVAARHAIEVQFRELMRNLAGTREGTDIEALHDMRVASRRLRAAMSVFASAFDRRDFEPLEKEVACLTDALGAVRDSDVLIEFLSAKAASSPSTHSTGLDSIVNSLNADRDSQRIILVKELDRLDRGKFSRKMLKLVSLENDD